MNNPGKKYPSISALNKIGLVEKSLCGKLVNQITTVFVCFDCRIHPDSMWCKECFEAGNHEGHNWQS